MVSMGKRTLLCLGVGFASLNSQAEVIALDEAAMASVTGQAGISIEINDAEITMGEILYKDEGGIAVRDIRIGGANRTNFFGNQWLPSGLQSDKLDNVKLDIDVMADGDLVAIMKPAGGFNVVDFSLTTDDWLLMDSNFNDGTKLIDSLSIEGVALDARLRVDNQTEYTFIETTFGIDDLDVDVEFLNLRVENMQVAGSSYIEAISTWGPSGAGIPDIGAEVDLEIYAAGSQGLGLNLTKFQMDIVMPEIYLGDNPSIGALYVNNVDITAQTVIYGH